MMFKGVDDEGVDSEGVDSEDVRRRGDTAELGVIACEVGLMNTTFGCTAAGS